MAIISNEAYLSAWGFTQPITGREFWRQLIFQVSDYSPEVLRPWMPYLLQINAKGILAERILHSLEGNYAHSNLQKVYGELVNCLQEDQVYCP